MQPKRIPSKSEGRLIFPKEYFKNNQSIKKRQKIKKCLIKSKRFPKVSHWFFKTNYVTPFNVKWLNKPNSVKLITICFARWNAAQINPFKWKGGWNEGNVLESTVAPNWAYRTTEHCHKRKEATSLRSMQREIAKDEYGRHPSQASRLYQHFICFWL